MGEILTKEENETSRTINGTRYIRIPKHLYNLSNLDEGYTLALEKGKHGLKLTIWSEDQPIDIDEGDLE